MRIDADDDLGRERLCRYGARPMLSLERLRMLPGGRVAYRVKKLGRGRAKTRVMTPLELLARLSALIPPPRYPLVRYHGVLAPSSQWRRDIVPRPRAPLARNRPCAKEPTRNEERERDAKTRSAQPSNADAQRKGRAVAKPVSKPSCRVPPQPVTALTPNVLSVRHWDRLLGGLLLATSPRIDWASLLRRSFAVDVLECPSCRARLRIVGEVTDPAVVTVLLEALGVDPRAPCPARARDPTELLGGDDTVD